MGSSFLLGPNKLFSWKPQDLNRNAGQTILSILVSASNHSNLHFSQAATLFFLKLYRFTHLEKLQAGFKITALFLCLGIRSNYIIVENSIKCICILKSILSHSTMVLGNFLSRFLLSLFCHFSLLISLPNPFLFNLVYLFFYFVFLLFPFVRCSSVWKKNIYIYI